MKVFIINSMCGSGSTGRIVSDTYSILKLQGDKVKIAYGLGQATRVDDDDVVKINNKVGYYLHNALSRLTDRTGLFSKKQTKKMIEIIDSFNPDIIQLHNLHGYWMNYEMLFEYLIQKDIPVIWTLHDCWSFTGHCAHFDYCGCDKWKNICTDCKQLKEYPKCYFKGNEENNFLLKKKLYSRMKKLTIVTPSNWLAKLVRDSILKNHNIQVINNGIDLEVFKPSKSLFREKYSLEDKVVLLGVANAWNEKKGLSDFVKLSMIIPENNRIVMVGLTEKQIKSLPKNIIGIQRTSSVNELAEIYSAADVFVNLTYEDTFPTVNIEALACGLPVITYDTGGSPEIIDNSCGIVVRKGDIKQVKQSIDLAKRLACEKAVLRAKKYNKNEKYQEYLLLYRKLISLNDKGEN